MTSQIWRSHPLEVFHQSEVRARISNYEVSPWSQLSNLGSEDLFKHIDIHPCITVTTVGPPTHWEIIPTGRREEEENFEFKDIPTGYLSRIFIFLRFIRKNFQTFLRYYRGKILVGEKLPCCFLYFPFFR